MPYTRLVQVGHWFGVLTLKLSKQKLTLLTPYSKMESYHVISGVLPRDKMESYHVISGVLPRDKMESYHVISGV